MSSDSRTKTQHRTRLRPFFHTSHVKPSTFSPLIDRFLQRLPLEPFDIQARIQVLATEMSLNWICGEEVSTKEAEQVGSALLEAQRIVSRRVKIGTVWVSSHLDSLKVASI